MSKLNEYQETLKSVYGMGENSNVQDRSEVADCGDTLFEYLFVELATSEGCDSRVEAIRRLHAVSEDVQNIIEAFEKA